MSQSGGSHSKNSPSLFPAGYSFWNGTSASLDLNPSLTRKTDSCAIENSQESASPDQEAVSAFEESKSIVDLLCASESPELWNFCDDNLGLPKQDSLSPLWRCDDNGKVIWFQDDSGSIRSRSGSGAGGTLVGAQAHSTEPVP